MIKTKKVDTETIRTILVGLITSKDFLSKFTRKYDDSFFQDNFGSFIYSWCLNHYEKYKEAPNELIIDYYEDAVRKKQIPKQIHDSVCDLLASLSEDFMEKDFELNTEYLLNEASVIDTINSASNLALELQEAASKKDTDYIKEAIERIKLRSDHEKLPSTSLFQEDIVDKMFEQEADPLFLLPGGVGELFNVHLTRDSLITFLGPEKRGKSWALMLCFLYALRARRNAVFFGAGDMSDVQYHRRFYTMLTHLPFFEYSTGDYITPQLDCEHNQNGTCPVFKGGGRSDGHSIFSEDGGVIMDDLPYDYTPCNKCRNAFKGSDKVFTPKIMHMPYVLDRVYTKSDVAYYNKVLKRRIRKNSNKILCYPNSSINVRGINNVLMQLREEENFIPDVICVDYADILAPERGGLGEREQHDERWKALRRLSQEHNALVLTATQGTRDSNVAELIDVSHQSEDKRKNAHVTAMIALNQTLLERQMGIMRMGFSLLREGDWDLETQAVMLQNLRAGIVHEDSFVMNYWKYKKEVLGV